MAPTIWIHQTRNRPGWYELPPHEQDRLRAQWDEADAVQKGAILVGRYTIRGQSDYSTLEVWELPSPEAAYDFWDNRVRAGYTVWNISANLVGRDVHAAARIAS